MPKKVRIKPNQRKPLRDSRGRRVGNASMDRKGNLRIDLEPPKP